MDPKTREAFENIKFYKFYPVKTPDTPDVSNVKVRSVAVLFLSWSIWTCTGLNLYFIVLCSQSTSTDITAMHIIWCSGIPNLTCSVSFAHWLSYIQLEELVLENFGSLLEISLVTSSNVVSCGLWDNMLLLNSVVIVTLRLLGTFSCAVYNILQIRLLCMNQRVKEVVVRVNQAVQEQSVPSSPFSKA